MSSRLVPCSRGNFIHKLRELGFDGPFVGGKHQYMTKKGHATIRVPNPHRGDISVDLLKRILVSAGIDRDDWIKA
ncbi:MAG: type II toxin-antitoxin system HicA family toxin [Candidatus Binataceae bacterium]